MIRRTPPYLAPMLLVVFAVGCGAGASPIAPTAFAAPALDAFVGSWSSSITPAIATPAGCSAIDYQITPGADGQSARVQFSGTCAGVSATGTGQGRLVGDTLAWTADGTAGMAGLSCPFSFRDSTAVLEGNNVRVTYRGTVCGLPVSGSQVLSRR
jgi:hypothetical protein